MKIGSTIRAASAAVCILAGCVLTVGVIVAACNRHEMAVDMVNAYVPAARAMLHGGSPYGLRPLASQEAFVYPPVAAVAVAPLTLLSGVGLQAVSVVLTVAAVLGALWLAGVRDPRCFLAALGCCPMMQAVQTGNLVVFVALGAAVMWRFRDRPVVAGVAAGTVVALKLFAWPLLLFLLLRRQWRATTVAVCAAVVALAVPWAAIGFQGLRGYPGLLASLDHLQRVHSYTLDVTARADTLLEGSGGRRARSRRRLGLVGGSARSPGPVRRRRRDHATGQPNRVDELPGARPAWHWRLRGRRSVLLWLLPLLPWFGHPTGWAQRWQLVLVLAVAGALLAAAERPLDQDPVDVDVLGVGASAVV